jgi:hypothetical protein
VTATTERVYDLKDKGTQTEFLESDSLTDRVQEVAQMQTERVRLDIGGKIFVTSEATIHKFPDALLYRLIRGAKPCTKSEDGVPTYFVDRDPKYFPVLMHYLRDGPKSCVPSRISMFFILCLLKYGFLKTLF